MLDSVVDRAVGERAGFPSAVCCEVELLNLLLEQGDRVGGPSVGLLALLDEGSGARDLFLGILLLFLRLRNVLRTRGTLPSDAR